MSEQEVLVPADVAQVAILRKLLSTIETELNSVRQEVQGLRADWLLTQPEGIIEPLAPLTVTTEQTLIQPPYHAVGKFWFSVVIVKEARVELNVIVNTGESGTTPHTMSVDEKVYDVYFNKACVKDLLLWTNSGSCTVKVRGAR